MGTVLIIILGKRFFQTALTNARKKKKRTFIFRNMNIVHDPELNLSDDEEDWLDNLHSSSSSSSSSLERSETTGAGESLFLEKEEEEEEENGRSLDDIFLDLLMQSEKSDARDLNGFTSFDDCEIDLTSIAQPTAVIASNDLHLNNLHARAKINESIAKFEILAVFVSKILADDKNCPTPLQLTLEEKITKNTGGDISWNI